MIQIVDKFFRFDVIIRNRAGSGIIFVRYTNRLFVTKNQTDSYQKIYVYVQHIKKQDGMFCEVDKTIRDVGGGFHPVVFAVLRYRLPCNIVKIK
ncbi:MAG: hypothetical protein LBT09_10765 [Planctomycetaceae bacterium]|jgi:hypothetical protein|nr:hypothetical protein [Planctomycetaceae bacterium]